MSLIINALTSQTASNFVQNSAFQVLSEGSLKAIGRPAFTLMDKTATKQERKYSATKEFVYQSLSMLAYFGLIFPVRNNSYKLLKHFPQLKNYEITNSKTNKEFQEKLKTLSDDLAKTKIKGAQELISIIASGIILAIITPQIVTKLIHPILNNINKNDDSNKKLDKTV